jgi:3',5'-cyclic AMP phosphodiesterase CpdA
MKIAGMSLGAGALYQALPGGRSAAAMDMFSHLGRRTGEALQPFTFYQLSDTHVGFNGAPNPTGTKAFERAVEVVNGLAQQPDFVIFTGDLSHDSENKDEHATRMKRFKEIASQLKVKAVHVVPGEHDAGLDSGVLFREHFGPTNYSFDHKGVHFVALDSFAGQAGGGRGTDRVAQEGPFAFLETSADRGLHTPAAVRPEAGVGVVHQRRRRRDERARSL